MYMRTQEQWDNLWRRLSVDRGIPQPSYVYDEQGDKLQNMVERINAGHDKLTEVFDEYKPEILIIIGGDQTEMFDRSNVPQFMIYLGDHANGNRPGTVMGAPPPGEEQPPQVEMEVDVEFSKWLLEKLVKEEGFDVAFSYEMKNLPGRRQGLPHAFVNPASYLLENTAPKVVLVYENTYDPPSLSGARCYEFGQAIARLVKNDPRRIAILGSGGLAHDPGGKRSGWLDQPLDRWFLDQIAAGNGQATKAMYSFESDTMVGGTGEIRAWITVAGAMEEMGSHAEVIDYVEAAKTVTGLGFAYWQTEPAAVSTR
jgi:protocatechuate 4,5-dioxygenase beta chain